jgi:NAD-reducing hydrogenase large subunit
MPKATSSPIVSTRSVTQRSSAKPARSGHTSSFPTTSLSATPGGKYRVGPLARLNVAESAGTYRADREMHEFKQRSKGAVCQSFHYHLARLIEMLHSVERIQELMEDPEILSEDIRARALLNRREGIGSCEAPRGTLFHHYQVDSDGLVKKANLLIATAQNNLAMNMAVEQTARRFVSPRSVNEGMLNHVEAAIRRFDPCLSCATHAIGQMPLIIELRNLAGDLLHRLERS